ncbi:ribulose-phosphate 3-epimerase [Candidatus Peregrinibacteria bacterium HGW-Peregrinibacteria-1]|jgi:ribulose-phosphate 3-epimerase|nr:MAG: ribulose-phosphate 3-epimerase [Candidatus Peregrinibacteria bacterium HGW-Peregrinibacteria-1]
MKYKLAPSILSADFGRLNEQIDLLRDKVELFHIDVMDGHFVPNISFGAPVMKWIDKGLFLDVHLMIENPEKYVEDFIRAGGDRIIVHAEATDDLRGLLGKIVDLGALPGVSIKPSTPVESIFEVLDVLDEVLIMTVEPGFGGQEFMEDMMPKIKELRAHGFEGDIGVDGGINAETAKVCIEAGANLLIAGSYIYGADDPLERVELLKRSFA